MPDERRFERAGTVPDYKEFEIFIRGNLDSLPPPVVPGFDCLRAVFAEAGPTVFSVNRGSLRERCSEGNGTVWRLALTSERGTFTLTISLFSPRRGPG